MKTPLAALSILSLVTILGTDLGLSLAADAPTEDPGLSSQPLPLDGIPMDFRCSAELDPGHPLLMDQPGIDLHELRTDPKEDPEAVLSRLLCGQIWQRLEEAGAHRIPTGLSLPAHARIDLRLESATIIGQRIINQRIGRTVVPVVVPHWSLVLQWALEFSVQFAQGGRGQTFSLRPRSGAEQGDYEALRLDRLLAATTRSSFRGLPRLLADEGNLGDLLFVLVEQPEAAPSEFGLPEVLDRNFWLLLSWNTEARHAAMAFVLSAPRVDLDVRRELARWFILNDPDVGTRRDALAWLLNNPAEPDTELDTEQAQLITWLLRSDRSARMRSEAVQLIHQKNSPLARKLLLIASTDTDLRVADLAGTHLRRLPAATARELSELTVTPEPPKLDPWTAALDG
ncbi:MAG: hypothetical protein VX498_04725, partial [Myxococcota bacterium]|nr:hypothetical protein [Myxococcota bacterium]